MREVRLSSADRVLFPEDGITKGDLFAYYERVAPVLVTIASVYSVRPRPGAPVSTPLRWEELTRDVRPRDFTTAVALERVGRHGDLFAPVLAEPRPLGAAARALARLAA